MRLPSQTTANSTTAPKKDPATRSEKCSEIEADWIYLDICGWNAYNGHDEQYSTYFDRKMMWFKAIYFELDVFIWLLLIAFCNSITHKMIYEI